MILLVIAEPFGTPSGHQDKSDTKIIAPQADSGTRRSTRVPRRSIPSPHSAPVQASSLLIPTDGFYECTRRRIKIPHHIGHEGWLAFATGRVVGCVEGPQVR